MKALGTLENVRNLLVKRLMWWIALKEAGVSGEDDLNNLFRQLERFGFIQRNTDNSIPAFLSLLPRP